MIMGVLKVKDSDGNSHVLDAVEGWRVMEILREHGMPIEGLCGGACACATCHVIVDAAWVDKLHAANDEEENMLDTVPSLASTSRLSCQIIYQEELDGLELLLDGAGI